MKTKQLLRLTFTAFIIVSLFACKSTKVTEGQKGKEPENKVAHAQNAKETEQQVETTATDSKPATNDAENGKLIQKKKSGNTFQISGNNVIVDNETVPLDKIPLDWMYDFKRESQTSGDTTFITTKRLFASNNKKYIALSTGTEYYNEVAPFGATGKFELIDANGNLIWSKEMKKRGIVKAYIADDLNYVHVIWSYYAETDSTYLLKTYDKSGNEIFTDINTERLYCSNDKSVIYYTKYNGIRSEPSNTIFCANVAKSINWEKKFDNEAYINAVSGNGEYVICYSNRASYCIKNGKTLWNQENDQSDYQLSDNGEYFIRVLNNDIIDFYRTELFSRIFTKNGENIDGKFIPPYRGHFVEMEDNIICMSYDFSPKNPVYIFYDYNGRKLGEKRLTRSIYSNIRIISDSKGKYTIYYGGIKAAEYVKTW